MGIDRWITVNTDDTNGAVVGPMTPTQAILAAEADRYRAMTDGDVDAVRASCDPKLHYVSSWGAVDTLDSWLAKIATETVWYERIEHPVDAVQIYDRVAIVNGRAVGHGTISGEPASLSVITLSVLVSDEHGHWRLRAFQATAAS